MNFLWGRGWRIISDEREGGGGQGVTVDSTSGQEGRVSVFLFPTVERDLVSSTPLRLLL